MMQRTLQMSMNGGSLSHWPCKVLPCTGIWGGCGHHKPFEQVLMFAQRNGHLDCRRGQQSSDLPTPRDFWEKSLGHYEMLWLGFGEQRGVNFVFSRFTKEKQ